MSPQQLRWVTRNRQGRPTAVRAVSVAQTLLKRLAAPSDALAAAWAEFAATAGPDFQAQCALGGLRAGTLMILVNDGRLLAALRARWLFPLREWLRQHRPGLYVGRIEFRERHAAT